FFFSGNMRLEFEVVAFGLDVVDICGLALTEHGFELIKVACKRVTVEGAGSCEDNKEQIRRELLNEKIDPMEAQEKVNKLMKDAEVDVKIDEYKDLYKDLDQNDDEKADDEADEETEE